MSTTRAAKTAKTLAARCSCGSRSWTDACAPDHLGGHRTGEMCGACSTPRGVSFEPGRECMTVRELIAELQLCNPEAGVIVGVSEDGVFAAAEQLFSEDEFVQLTAWSTIPDPSDDA